MGGEGWGGAEIGDFTLGSRNKAELLDVQPDCAMTLRQNDTFNADLHCGPLHRV